MIIGEFIGLSIFYCLIRPEVLIYWLENTLVKIRFCQGNGKIEWWNNGENGPVLTAAVLTFPGIGYKQTFYPCPSVFIRGDSNDVIWLIIRP